MRLVLILAVLAGSALSPAVRAASAQAPKVLVVESAGTTAPDKRRPEIRASVELAAHGVGAEIVSAAKVPAKLARCITASCAASLGKATGANYMLLVDAAYADDGFKFQLQIYDATNGKQVVSTSQVCEVCAFPDFRKALRERTTALCTQAFQEEPTHAAPAEVEVPNPPSAPLPATAQPDVIVPIVPLPPKAAGPSTTRRVLPIVGAGTGLALAATGAYTLSRNGKSACADGDPTPCPYKRNTVVGGTTLLAGGLVVGGLSAYFWATTPKMHELGILVGPTSVALVGGF